MTPSSERGRDRSTRPSADPTRDRIVNAAAELFSARSFEGATTRQIAARAGVAQPLLNYHFTSKETLWQAAVDSLFTLLDQHMNARLQTLGDVDDVTRARLIVRDFIGFSARHPQLHRIILQESTAAGARMDYLLTHVRPIYESTIEMFANLAEQGAVPAIPPTHLYYILTGGGPTMFVLGPECQELSGLDPTSDAVIEAHADAICRLLFNDPPFP
ncbi:MAG TPA: TetR/AcrR family transcriptional regulator [Ilumatobacter sp.]|nr:TetR/AcrR family transcriptional regulator [Ilumatobacter sp.]